MADILYDFPIFVPSNDVFEVISTPKGLDAWWTRRAAGEAVARSAWEFGFGAGYDWRAVVSIYTPCREIEWELTEADEDWLGTKVGFRLMPSEKHTTVQFHHSGWAAIGERFRVASFCWAMYLRLLKRHLEYDETVPYTRRLEV